MKRKIQISDCGLVDGLTKYKILDIFPELDCRFRQRKQYEEFYFDYTEDIYNISLEQLDELTKEFNIEIGCDSIVIQGDLW